jgi:hypothetical protein
MQFCKERDCDDVEGSVPSCRTPGAMTEAAFVESAMKPPVIIWSASGSSALPLKPEESCNVPSSIWQPERASRSDCCATTVTPPDPHLLALAEGIALEIGEGEGGTEEDEEEGGGDIGGGDGGGGDGGGGDGGGGGEGGGGGGDGGGGGEGGGEGGGGGDDGGGDDGGGDDGGGDDGGGDDGGGDDGGGGGGGADE